MGHQVGGNTVKDIDHLAMVFNMRRVVSLGLCGERLSCGGSLLRACFTAVRMFDPIVCALGVLATLLMASKPWVSLGAPTKLKQASGNIPHNRRDSVKG